MEKLSIYESLIIEMTSLEKEVENLNMEYTREFGDEIQEVFGLKLEAVKLKKAIAYCNRSLYEGKPINVDDLNDFLSKKMEKYEKDFAKFVLYKNAIEKGGRFISDEEMREIKTIYYKIVKMVHPDLHPELKDDKKIKALWQKAVDAYKRNDKTVLSRTYDSLLIILKGKDKINIEDLDLKISILRKDIDKLKTAEFLRRKEILDSELNIVEEHSKLKKTIVEYEKYIKELKEEFSKFNIEFDRFEA